MKNLVKVALVAICILSMGSFANAQQKIGYVNADAIMAAMPESKTISSQMQAYSKTFQDKLVALQTELQTKANDYQKKQASMTDADRTVAQGELGDLQKRMQEFQNTAQQQIDAKAQEYLKPLNEKVRTAIQAVATEKGYAYVLNTANTDLLVSPAGDNLEAAVKLKLAIK
jgi:outer membrane protein